MTVGMFIFWAASCAARFFAASPELMRIGTVELKLSRGIPTCRVLDYARRVFQALGKSVYSMYVSVMRQLIDVTANWHTSCLKSSVTSGVWFSFVFAEFFGLSMSIIYTRKIKKDCESRL